MWCDINYKCDFDKGVIAYRPYLYLMKLHRVLQAYSRIVFSHKMFYWMIYVSKI